MVYDAALNSPPARLWPLLKGVSFRFVPLLAAGKRRSQPSVANSQRCLAPVRVVFGLGRRPLWIKMGLALEKRVHFQKGRLS